MKVWRLSWVKIENYNDWPEIVGEKDKGKGEDMVGKYKLNITKLNKFPLEYDLYKLINVFWNV